MTAGDSPPKSAFAEGVARRVEARAHPRRPPAVAEKAWLKARVEVEGMMASGDWVGCGPLHLAAAYDVLHESVFGVRDAECAEPRARAMIVFAARRMLAAHFLGDAGAMAEFVRWTWQREQWREKKRRGDGTDGWRMPWRLAFGPSVLTDWRASRHRKSAQEER